MNQRHKHHEDGREDSTQPPSFMHELQDFWLLLCAAAPTPAKNAFVLHRSHGSPLGSKQAASLLSAFCLFAFNSSHIRERPESRSHSQQAESSDFPSAFESCVKLHLVLPVFLQRPSGRNRAATAPLRPTAGEQRRRFRWDLTPPNPILRRPLSPRLHYSQPGPLLPEPPGHGVAITTTAERKQPPPPALTAHQETALGGTGEPGKERHGRIAGMRWERGSPSPRPAALRAAPPHAFPDGSTRDGQH